MDSRTIYYQKCDNCPCIVNELCYFVEHSHIVYHLILCKKCQLSIKGDLECAISKADYVLKELPYEDKRQQYLKRAIKIRDDCREARIRNKKLQEERWANEGKCLIVDDE